MAVKDSAKVDVVGGTAAPTGSVAFSLCKLDSGLCTTGRTTVGSTNLTGSAYPVTVLSSTAYVTSAGRYCWRATWSGDAANGIVGTGNSSAGECFTVNPVTPATRHLRPPRVCAVRDTNGPIRALVDLTVVPRTEDLSRLTISVDFQGHGICRILVPLMVRSEARKQVPVNLAKLKARLES